MELSDRESNDLKECLRRIEAKKNKKRTATEIQKLKQTLMFIRNKLLLFDVNITYYRADLDGMLLKLNTGNTVSIKFSGYWSVSGSDSHLIDNALKAVVLDEAA